MTWIREKILVQLFNTTILQNGITYWEGAVTLANFYRQRKKKKNYQHQHKKGHCHCQLSAHIEFIFTPNSFLLVNDEFVLPTLTEICLGKSFALKKILITWIPI